MYIVKNRYSFWYLLNITLTRIIQLLLVIKITFEITYLLILLDDGKANLRENEHEQFKWAWTFIQCQMNKHIYC